MKELQEISKWVLQHAFHKLDVVDSLPAPSFAVNGVKHVSFSSNNYLGLSADKRTVAAAIEGLTMYGVGNCESRLLGGNLKIYEDFEDKIAKLKGKESAILFATGYLTNLGFLATLPKIAHYARIYGYRAKKFSKYEYFSDEYNHASIKEGIKMSGVQSYAYRHVDLVHLEELLQKSDAENKIIVTDGVFSQDGDIAPLPQMLALAHKYNAMIYIDDAHGTGVLGANGGGILEHFNVNDDRIIYMGTLSKAYGAIGGFVATKEHIIFLMRLTCSSYGFTSTLPPDQVFALSKAVDLVHEAPELRKKLWENQHYFVSKMKNLRYKILSTTTPIVPVLLNSEAVSDEFERILAQNKIHVDSVKFPAIPFGKARLRVILNAWHTFEEIDHLVEVLAQNQHLLPQDY